MNKTKYFKNIKPMEGAKEVLEKIKKKKTSKIEIESLKLFIIIFYF